MHIYNLLALCLVYSLLVVGVKINITNWMENFTKTTTKNQVSNRSAIFFSIRGNVWLCILQIISWKVASSTNARCFPLAQKTLPPADPPFVEGGICRIQLWFVSPCCLWMSSLFLICSSVASWNYSFNQTFKPKFEDLFRPCMRTWPVPIDTTIL